MCLLLLLLLLIHGYVQMVKDWLCSCQVQRQTVSVVVVEVVINLL